MVEEIPIWAIDRAMELAGYNSAAQYSTEEIVENPREYRWELAFARYIAAHEEAPVDLVEVELADALRFYFPNDLRLYANDEKAALSFRSELLRRGLKIVEASDA